MVQPTESSSYRGVSESLSSFEKNSATGDALKTSKGNERKSSADIRQQSMHRKTSADEPSSKDKSCHGKGASLVSQSSVTSRKNDQWNVKRDIPVGTVRNNPFLPERKPKPPQLKYQKKQWDTSNIPKGSVAARIQESNSPRKKSGGDNPVSPTKVTAKTNGRLSKVSNTSRGFSVSSSAERGNSGVGSPRVTFPKSGTSSWQPKPKSSYLFSSNNPTRQQQSQQSNSTIRRWEPSREIPNGTVKGRLSAFHDTLKETNLNDTSTSHTANTNMVDHDSSTMTTTKNTDMSFDEKLNDGEDQWIIPENNAANTQVFASDWGEAIPTKSAESDDWDASTKEWIHSGECQSESFSADENSKLGSGNQTSTPPTDILSRDETIHQGRNENIPISGDMARKKNVTVSKLAPPPKDASAYHTVEGKSFASETSIESEVLKSKFNDDFKTFATKSEIVFKDHSTGSSRFQSRDESDQNLRNIASDAFGFPVTSSRLSDESQNIGEIVGGDEFFDASTILPSKYSQPSNEDDHEFDMHQYSSVTGSRRSAEDETQISFKEINRGKVESKKKRKGFFKGLFGRKSKENGKLKQSTKESKKTLVQKERSHSKSDLSSRPSTNPSETNFQDTYAHDGTFSNQNSGKSENKTLEWNVENAEQQSGNLAMRENRNKQNVLRGKSQRSTVRAPLKFSNEFKDTFTPQQNSFQDCFGMEFSRTDDDDLNESKVVHSVGSNVTIDDVFDGLESDAPATVNSGNQDIGDSFLDPELDHLGSNDSEEESNEGSESVAENHVEIVKQKLERTLSAFDSETSILKKENSERVVGTKICNVDGEEPVLTEEHLYGERKSHFDITLKHLRSTEKYLSNVPGEGRNDIPRNLSEFSSRLEGPRLRAEEERKEELIKSTSKAHKHFDEVLSRRPAEKVSTNTVQKRLGTTHESVKSNTKFSKDSLIEDDGTRIRFTKASLSVQTTTDVIKSPEISSQFNPPMHSHSDGHDSLSGGNFLSKRYTKNSVFKKVLTLQDGVREDSLNSVQQQGKVKYVRYTRPPYSIRGSQHANEQMEKSNFHPSSGVKDGTQRKKFSKASHAYKSISKRNLNGEDCLDQRKFLSIPAASTSASDISFSSTYDSYQKKLAESLRKANIVTQNSSDYSLHSNSRSLDDSSIESDIRVLKSILRRPRLDHDNKSVIAASRQIEGFPTYDTESATDPMQRVGLRLLSSAIIPIQTEVRRFLAMRHALTRMWALIVVQTYTRRFLAQKKFQKTLRCTLTIQAVVRGHLARNEIIDKHICAIEIQRFVRGYLATMQVYEDIYKVTLVQSLVRMRLAMDYAAYRMSLIIQLQAITRGFLARRRRSHLDNCATLIQSSWRCFYNRLTYQFDLLDIIIVQSMWRRKLGSRIAARKVEERRARCATIIQAEWRAYDCRMDFLCYISARRIQTKWRSHVCRMNYIDYQASRIIQSAARMFLCRLQYIDYQAATIIQSLARMYFCRIDYSDYQSAKKIQSVVRMFLCRSQYVEYQCASKIQSIGRMHLCRCDYLEYRAATTLQSVVRMYMCRSGYVEYQCATRIQSIGRMYLCRYDYLEYRAATTLQAAVRMFFCRSDYIEYQSATIIQSAWRSHDCRMDYLFYISSRKIQSVGRMFLCRVKYIDYKEATASTAIQSTWRAFCCRREFTRFTSARLIQTRWRAYMCRKIYIENFAATMIQAKWRSYDCSSMYKRYCSARIIQKTWRSYDCQMNFLHFLADILIVQSTIRRFLIQRKVKAMKNNAATMIQRTWRGFVCFADYEEFKAAKKIQNAWRRFHHYNAYQRHKASIRIQSAWRGLICYIDYHEYLTVRRIQSAWRAFVCRRNYKREKAAIIIQCTWRGFLFYADYMFELSDIVVVQKQIRVWLAKRVANNRLCERQNNAAITIQKNWKCKVNQTAYAAIKRDHRACTTIQTYWRRFWCFSNFIIALDCSIQIQSQIRAYLQRKEYLSQRFASIVIETAWRKAQAMKLKSELIVIREITNCSKNIAKEQSSAATKIQQVFRGSLCRKALKVHLAAVLIQSCVRGKQARVAVKLYVAIRKIQSLWRAFTPRRSYKTYVAARKIQAAWRRFIPRQGYVTFIAARCIQNNWRCNRAKKDLLMLKTKFRAASLIQSVWRGFVSYTDFVFTLSDIVVAQRIARGYLSRKKYYGTIRSNINKTKGRLNGAISIQRVFRGFQARQNYWYTLGCTMQIQSWWRGRRVYRKIKMEANALLVIQCFIRCSLARQEFMQRRFVLMLIKTAELERSKKNRHLNMTEQAREDMEEYEEDKAARADTLAHVPATEQRKKWRKEMKGETRTDDIEEALLEDVWTNLVSQSQFEEEPFTRHYSTYNNPRRVVEGNYDNLMAVDPHDNGDEANNIILTGSTINFASHPTSSIRLTRKVDANNMDDDFQLEEAFIDAKIRHAKERRHFAGSCTNEKVYTASGSFRGTRKGGETGNSSTFKIGTNGKKKQSNVLTLSNY